jgi:hypothetical protein
LLSMLYVKWWYTIISLTTFYNSSSTQLQHATYALLQGTYTLVGTPL